MKKLFLIGLCCLPLILTGCHQASVATSLNYIQQAFPNSEVATIPGDKYEFIVRDTNNAIYYVACLSGDNDNITDSVKILPAKK